MPATRSNEKFLSVDSQLWIAKRVGIDLEAVGLEKGADLLLNTMRRMLVESIEVDGKPLDYDILAKEMVKANVGLEYLDNPSASEGAKVASMSHGLLKLFLVDETLESMRSKPGSR